MIPRTLYTCESENVGQGQYLQVRVRHPARRDIYRLARQAVGNKIGALKNKELRAEATKDLGASSKSARSIMR